MDERRDTGGGTAREAERMRAEIGRLRAALRVNLLRLSPTTSHDEIDALIERIKTEGTPQ